METLNKKTGTEVATAFKSIFIKGRTPKKLWVDKGKEFYNQDVIKVLVRIEVLFSVFH